ncbi:MAG: cardiolipin synthase ClsB [Proteobacteria bacterium]|nr:cardiolipin synthase ClsB [Pseudomonadota bacterium]
MSTPALHDRRRWTDGNHFELLENGEAFFPAVFEAIARAQTEVLLETFILFEDKVGLALHTALLGAARRGVRVHVMIDGYGSPDLSQDFIGSLCAAGVQVHVFEPAPRIFGWRPNVLRRMHRKIVVVDAQLAFVGGINYSADHLGDFGPGAKQDWSVAVRGPVVAHIHRFCHAALAAGHGGRLGRLGPFGIRQWFRDHAPLRRRPAALPASGDAQALFVTRDNHNHPSDIEHHYLQAVRGARQRVVIANAYFFPGWRFIRELRRAARRGVDVRLILQGEPDMPIVKTAASLLYHHLTQAGVRIYEYCDRPLHGKVAVVDGDWSTVGSSNLDPLSLALNLEANVIIRDRAFNHLLSQRLEHLMRHSCKQVRTDELAESSTWRLVRSYFVFHVLRRYPSWARLLPRHAARLSPALGEDALTPVCATSGGKDAR